MCGPFIMCKNVVEKLALVVWIVWGLLIEKLPKRIPKTAKIKR